MHQLEAIFWRCTPRKITAMWHEHLRLNGLLKKDDSEENAVDGEIITRGGKQYRKVDPAKASWLYE